jgi:hypothetical protein
VSAPDSNTIARRQRLSGCKNRIEWGKPCGDTCECTATALSTEQRADLIADISDRLSDRNDVDVGFDQFAEAVVELLEARGLIRFPLPERAP